MESLQKEVNVFFFNDTATTEIYTLSLHDALPIFIGERPITDEELTTAKEALVQRLPSQFASVGGIKDRKSTRLNSSHSQISYAVFCLKKKKLRSSAVGWIYYNYAPPRLRASDIDS